MLLKPSQKEHHTTYLKNKNTFIMLVIHIHYVNLRKICINKTKFTPDKSAHSPSFNLIHV